MKDFCKIFIVNNTQILVRKSIQIVNDKPVPTIFFTMFLEENYALHLNPEVEFGGADCRPHHMNERYDNIDQAFVEAIYERMKHHSKQVKSIVTNHFHQN